MKKILLILILIWFGCDSMPEEIKKPNVIIILTDQWRASALGYNGNKVVQTPNLDAFAREAVNFRNAVSVTPVCTPFRASLITGKYPSSTGMIINDLYLPAEELTMAEIFKEEGYQTAYLGKWHLDGHGRHQFVAPERRQGFEFWKGSECDHDYLNEHYYFNDDTTKKIWEGYSTYAIAVAAQEYMEQASKQSKPFLLFTSLATPHFPHKTAPQEYRDYYDSIDLNIPPNVPEDSKEEVKEELVGYYGHATATDKAIGSLIDKIKELELFDNSIILFTSDHGEMMGAHGDRPREKQLPYKESANIPFLISYPDIASNKGKVANAAITTPDVLPSILTLAEISIPNTIEGYDLSSIMKDPSTNSERAALYMNIFPFASNFSDVEYRAIKTDQYTYVKSPKGPYKFFDDRNDPYQMNNLIGNPEFADLQAKLDQTLIVELDRIGEKEIHERFHYLKKFNLNETDRYRPDYGFSDYFDPAAIVSPNTVEN